MTLRDDILCDLYATDGEGLNLYSALYGANRAADKYEPLLQEMYDLLLLCSSPIIEDRQRRWAVLDRARLALGEASPPRRRHPR